MNKYILGIDIGGASCKAAVYHYSGEVAGEGYSEYKLKSTRPGHAELSAEDWWSGSVIAIRSAIQRIDPEEIVSVGVSCTNGLVAVDINCIPLHNAIMLWDQRAIAEVDDLCNLLGRENIERVTGNPAAPGAYGLPTIWWLKKHRPDVLEKTHKFMVPGGFLVARLTGNFTIDTSRACTTQLLNIREGQWHLPFLTKLGIPIDKLPTLALPHEIVGRITDKAAKITGLKAGTPVVAGLTDTLAAAIGANSMGVGQTLIIMGTATRVTMINKEPNFDYRFMNFISIAPQEWLSIGAINGVGSVLRWVRDVIAVEEQKEALTLGKNPYDYIISKAIQSPPGAKGLLLLPYLSGERTPIWDPLSRGVLFGLSLSHNRSDILRAFLEGPAFAIRQAVELIEQKQPNGIERLTIGGTASQNRDWNQIISNILGKPLYVIHNSHVEVLGAAIVGALGIGVFKDLKTGMEQFASYQGERIDPDPALRNIYDGLFQLYERLYPSVSSSFVDLYKIDLPL